jgi:excinuclease ABC subunit C
MRQAAERLDFERAARLRDRIAAIRATLEKQRVGSSAGEGDRDVFGLAATDRHVWVSVLFIRDGNLQDAASYRFGAELGPSADTFGSFLKQFYAANRFIPSEVLIPVEVDDAAVLAQVLSEKKGRKVAVLCPMRGSKRRLVELACRNAAEAERVSTSETEKQRAEAESLRDILALRKAPRTIECFDISNLHGREAVGSMVVFRDGTPDKSSYRRYRIRTVEGQDDCAMLEEVLSRRYRHVVARDGKESERTMPDLIVIDGGRGQLSAAQKALDALGLGDAEVVALAKARADGKGERVFVRGGAAPVALPEHACGFRLITRVRDEAHRFAVSYHRKLRKNAEFQ